MTPVRGLFCKKNMNEHENDIIEMNPIESLADAFFLAKSIPEQESDATNLFDFDIDSALA